MSRYVLGLHEIDRTHVSVVGGKGAHLGALSSIEGIRVPPGFCVTTDAFRRFLTAAPSLDERIDRLSRLTPDDREAIAARSADIREAIEATTIPDDVATAITGALARLDETCLDEIRIDETRLDETRLDETRAYAVRSSATAEDLPTASFAGQQDTYLNIVGPASILEHVRRCWASLFTERAVAYRLKHGFDSAKVFMAVVVQRMVFPEAAGILFTADPVTGNRKVASVEASFGLGEALVSGRVNADVYEVREGEIIARTIATKQLVVDALPGGGTRERAIEPERQTQPALTDGQVVRLVELGRRIEACFGCPQDIEWCLTGEDVHVVQSRPITTLFPIPVVDDDENHVYVSVGHQQMMTDPMKPLGISFWQLTAGRPMYEAGGRLFVDVTQALASPAMRTGVIEGLGRSDPLIGDALRTLVERGDFVPTVEGAGGPPPSGPPPGGAPAPIETDPALVEELIRQSEASLAALSRDIATKTGPELLDFIVDDIQELKRIMFDPQSHRVLMAGFEATWWLNAQLEAWLGEKNAADILTQSVPYNVTSEMGLALLDVADAIRPHPEVVAFLQRVEKRHRDDVHRDDANRDDENLLGELSTLPGGREAHDALEAWLAKYGMRGVGEIDITRPRFRERPSTLVPLLLGHVRNFETGTAKRRFEQGLREASRKEQEVLERLRALPDGERKAEEAKQRIDRVRTFIGYREYPKYGMVCRYLVYKQALLREAERLVEAGVLREQEDIFYLTLPELHDVVRTHRVDDALLEARKEAFRSYQALTPPRVLTSDGEMLTGTYRRDAPAGALLGLAVSAGTIEGRARVVDDIAKADLEAGDILVTAYTDPSWTPLFVGIAGLVTEVGGLMTHGAVIAREYGVPAVVGVENATRLIRDGQRIRVHGTEGYVELLS